MNQFRSAIRYPRTSLLQPMSPRDVANAYNFPLHVNGTGYIGGIIELGGGYQPDQVGKYFAAQEMPTPKFVDVPVNGGANAPDGPDGADGEVQLDMIVAGAVAPAATFRVYFADNTDQGFLAALQQAIRECDGVSISWGGPEDSWDRHVMDQFESAIKAGRAAGVPVFVAAGDAGSRDGEGHPVVDFPASAPDAIGCGGTRLILGPGGRGRASEVVWDDSDTDSATGGGVSRVFPGRQVPDIAGNADPSTGYEIMVDGKSHVIGGTSAVAPLMLGLHALLWQLNGGRGFDFLDLVVTNPQAMFDVTSGDNGDYRAGPGRDQTTGFGVPDGGKLVDAMSVSVIVPPTPDAVGQFPLAALNAWLAHKHNHTHVEGTAAQAISAWAKQFGLGVG